VNDRTLANVARIMVKETRVKRMTGSLVGIDEEGRNKSRFRLLEDWRRIQASDDQNSPQRCVLNTGTNIGVGRVMGDRMVTVETCVIVDGGGSLWTSCHQPENDALQNPEELFSPDCRHSMIFGPGGSSRIDYRYMTWTAMLDTAKNTSFSSWVQRSMT
jgi:hypothetical protein